MSTANLRKGSNLGDDALTQSSGSRWKSALCSGEATGAGVVGGAKLLMPGQNKVGQTRQRAGWLAAGLELWQILERENATH